jgi:hypothetical protein
MTPVSYTIYAKVQPKPLVGDEHYPNGCVGIQIGPTPSLTLTELNQLISDLQKIAEEMTPYNGCGKCLS